MWEFEHTVDIDVPASAVWARYADVESWSDWYPDIKAIKLDGPFANGSAGVLEQDPAAGHHAEPVPFRLANVVENEGWTLRLMAPTDETGIQDEIAMGSTARIVPLPEGGVRVTHRGELSGPGSDEIGEAVGPWISKSLTQGLDSLKTLLTDAAAVK